LLATKLGYINLGPMKNYLSLVLVSALLLLTISACNIKDKKTTLEVFDSERHYYPILRGQTLDIVYEIKNTGEYPLFITDIHTSCGCILVEKSSFKVLPAGGNGFIRIKYNSSKNIGYVKHYVSVYANLESGTKKEVTFDLNVVPNALYTRDYEELHKEHKEKYFDEESLVDGKEKNKGYYVDNIGDK